MLMVYIMVYNGVFVLFYFNTLLTFRMVTYLLLTVCFVVNCYICTFLCPGTILCPGTTVCSCLFV